jgi:hypothetical protein
MGGAHGVQGNPEVGARLFGAADALRTAINTPVGGGERTDHEMLLAAVRSRLPFAKVPPCHRKKRSSLRWKE